MTKEEIRKYNLEWSRKNILKNREKARKWSAKNRKKVLEYVSKWKKENREKNHIYWSRYKLKNLDKTRQKSREWNRNNRGKVNACCAKRNAIKKLAMPKWADVEKIKKIYEKCDEITRITGIKHEVDHIYPLVSNVCCGLHCHTNLRIITAVENRKKGNRIPVGIDRSTTLLYNFNVKNFVTGK